MTNLKTILLIEDDELLRENLAEVLSLSNYRVLAAENGQKGVELAIKEIPHLILCDVIMPGLDGFGVFHILHAHPNTRTIPFIFLTGERRDVSDLRKAMNMGADDYLTKPIEHADLLKAVEIRLEKSLAKSASQTVYLNPEKIVETDLSVLTSIQKDVRNYKRKHQLYSVEEKITYVYLVTKGKLKGYMVNGEGKEFITNMYSEGDVMGLSSVLENSHYSENAEVLEDARLILIAKVDFIELLTYDAAVAARFIKKLSKQVKEKEERLLNLAYNSLRKKVAVGIINVIDKFKDMERGKPVIKISRDDLAKVIGAAPESMIRTLKEFKMEKSIEIVEGVIYVLDEKKLRSLPY